MSARPQLPGMRWFLWLRVASLRTGVLTGIYLSCILAAWLYIANRVAQLERFAGIRNLLAAAAFVMIMGIPALRFRRRPGKLFIAGLTAWTLFTLAYVAGEIHFTLLESRLGALHIFVLGAVSYGFIAVLDWVFLMCAGVRHQHVIQARQTPVSGGRHRTQ